jgi:acyl-CoA thioesterase-1
VIAPPIRYVALGDSYTIGTGTASSSERWPDQLVARLGGLGRLGSPAAAGGATPTVELVANLGVNGWTSRDVLEREVPQLGRLEPELVSLLVGVNDVVRGVPPDAYRANVAAILEELRARLPPDRIVAVSTPDYTVTPQGASYGDPVTQAAGIRRNNGILAELATDAGAAFVDIHDLSLLAAEDPRLIADDGLHPSAIQYSLWVDRIAPVVARLLAS